MSHRGAGAKKEKDEGPGLASTLLVAGGAAVMGYLANDLWKSWKEFQAEEKMSERTSRPFSDCETQDSFKRKEVAQDVDAPNAVKCIVCMENSRDIILMPCHHVCLCGECTKKIVSAGQGCPICRNPIREARAAYLP